MLDAIADAQESVRWLRAHATTYGIDPTRIAAVGDSAGGAIALGLAAAPERCHGGQRRQATPHHGARVPQTLDRRRHLAREWLSAP